MRTYTLRSGIEVAAKLYESEPSPLMYVNRTGAQKAAAKLGPDWTVYRGMGRPFYVARADQFAPLTNPVPTTGGTSRDMREPRCLLCEEPTDIIVCARCDVGLDDRARGHLAVLRDTVDARGMDAMQRGKNPC